MDIILNSYKSINKPIPLNAEEKEKAKEVLQIFIEPYTGSNEYTVGIYSFSISNSIIAKVSNPQGKKISVSQSNIINGLTNQPLDNEQILGIGQRPPGSFRAVYLPQSGKVQIWPHMVAAGQGHNRTPFLVTDNSNNPFLNKSVEQIIKQINSGNFTVPGTSYTVPENGLKPGSNARERHLFYLPGEHPTIVVMGGSSRQGGEPAHVEIYYNHAENEQGKRDCLKFPLTDPKTDPEWSRRIGAKGFEECKQVPSDITRQSPTGKPRGGGDGGGNSVPGGGGGGGGNSGPGGGSTSSFNNNLSNNGLVDSYNSTNTTNPMASGNAKGEIGGVAIHDPNAIMLNMHNSLYDLTADGYWLTFPSNTETAPFSNKELQQITRELAQTIYIHNTFPFYSLHFTKQGTLYSVIHPAYQNTLVGKVIAMLDYFMKGYLNGGYFEEANLKKFAENKAVWINNHDALKPAMRSIEEIHQRACPDGEYTSLAELIEQFQIKQYNFLDRLFSKDELKKIEERFQVSFRIIAKEDSIEKEFNTLLFNGSFDVFYTVEVHESAIGEVDQYKDTEEYKLLDYFCKYVANDIKEKLPKLDICKNYFAMLEVICGISYYFSTLKKHELVPSFRPIEVDREEKCLGSFPPYPKTKLEMDVQEHTLWDFLKDLPASNVVKLNDYLSGKVNQISPELQS